MKCPKCETATLQAVLVESVEVDRCSTCQGIWFDEKELATLLDAGSGKLRKLSGKEQQLLNLKRGNCPRDGAELLRVCCAENPDIVIDTCTKCGGIWLDGGELSKVRKG